jgi:hypothetical protein
MTNSEALKLTIARCERWLEEQLARTECLLIDLGATAEELEAAIGPGGCCSKMLCEDRDAQIREVERWLSGNDATLH